MIATAQFTISIVNDGVGIVENIIEYCISSSGTIVPGSPLRDGDGNIIYDINGLILTDGSWSSSIPTSSDGDYIWTRSKTVYSNGTFALAYMVSHHGENGAVGATGVSVVNVIPEFRLSDSSTSITGSGAGYAWSTNKPKVESGQYIWERQRNELSDGTVVYSDATCDITMSGVVVDVDQNKKAIAQKVWTTDITNSINQYDSSTTQTIRDRVSQTETDIAGITSTVSDVQSTLSTKADGSTVTALQNTVTQNKQTADAFQQTVQSTYAKLTDVDDKIDDIKIGGHNLYIIADEVPGYLHYANGTIQTQSAVYKEVTSFYIPVKDGENYIIQSWVTPNSVGESWLAYQFFSNNSGTPVNGRVSKYGGDATSGVETTADGLEHLTYDVQVPTGAKYLRVSYRKFNDGYAMVEKATKPSEYAINPKDLEQYADDVVESAKSEIKQTTDNISLEVSKKVGSDEVISKINQSPESITIDASKIDLIGKVTFNMLDTSTKNTITTLQSDVQTAQGTADSAVTAAGNAQTTANTAVDMSTRTLGMKINYSTFTSYDLGEVYLHGYTNNVAADVNGYVYWNGVKRNVAKTMINPNAILPYNKTIYIVLRLSSAAAQSGTLYMVWYDSAWKYAITPTPSAVGGTWTWNEATDVVLGQFVEPSSEAALVDAYLYEPPRNASHIITTGLNPYGYSQNAVNWVSNNGTNMTNALSMIKKWTNNAVSDTTTIQGGWIATNTITSQQLATNAIVSNNYLASDNVASPYSVTGTFLDLSNGNFWTPNFGVINVTPDGTSVPVGAWFNGTVYAGAGKFGSDTSYWNIETVYDYNNQPHAALVGTGSPYLQTGNWQVSDNAVATRKYTSTDATSGKATYFKDTGTNTFYDVGMKIPTNFAAYNKDDSTVVKYNKAFFYGRKYTGNSVPSIDADWTYFFMIDAAGNIFENGVKLSDKYASIDGVSGAYLPLTGGTISGNLTVSGTLTATASAASKLAASKNLNVNLATTSNSGKVAFNGSADATLGVTGTLGVGNGGTGKSSWTQYGIVYATATNALGQMAVGTSGQVLTSKGSAAPAWTNQSDLSVGSATKATQDSDGNAINTTYRKLSNTDFTELSTGNLVVTGAATFTNGLTGDLTGDVTGDVVGNVSGSAGSVVNNLKIQLNGGTTEGTNQFTYNGSAAKNINITKSSVGLGNVENTAISTWAGSANLTTTKVGTLAAAAVKGVDTSISAASTSSNLPTSAAVASFVEGKGYVTSSGVTSVRVQATSPIVSSQNTAQSSTLNTTISLADGYGDTKNPYETKTANYVLAGPSSGNAAAPSFRKLVAADIPSITKSKISDFPTTWELTNITGADDLKAIEGLTGTSGMLKKTAANTWSLVTVVSGFSVNNDKIIVTKSDGTTQELTINITGQVVSGATILSNSAGEGLNVGDASHPTYFSNGLPVQGDVIPTLAMNGSATTAASFYAPTGAGTSGQYLKSNGSGAPTWATFSKSTVGLGNVDNTADANKAVLTATKFATAQSVTLTGDTTGTASSQAGWSIATKTTQISTVGDKRNVATTPNDYSNKIIFQGLKAKATIDNPSDDTYSYLVGLRGWSDSSGGKSHELAFNNSGINRRVGGTTEWDDWYLMLDSNNFNDYAPALDGTGATGTWGIDISGNATTATTATYSYYPKFTSINEIRFDIGSKPSSATTIHIGYKWSDGTKEAKINRYAFYDGNSELAAVQASTFYGNLSGNATTASRVSGAAGTTNANRHVWFSDSATETARNYDDDFMYNPSTNTLTVTNVSGTATKATQDGDGNVISSTYAKLAGAAFTGAVTGTSFGASSYVSVNTGNSGTAGGLALYSTNPIQYGIAMRSTTNQAKHGFVQGDWATYFGMLCTTATAETRGWIFQGGSTQVPVASISTAGNAAFNGEVAIGTTGTDIDGSCSLVMDRDLGCLNFVFN